MKRSANDGKPTPATSAVDTSLTQGYPEPSRETPSADSESMQRRGASIASGGLRTLTEDTMVGSRESGQVSGPDSWVAPTPLLRPETDAERHMTPSYWTQTQSLGSPTPRPATGGKWSPSLPSTLENKDKSQVRPSCGVGDSPREGYFSAAELLDCAQDTTLAKSHAIQLSKDGKLDDALLPGLPLRAKGPRGDLSSERSGVRPGQLVELLGGSGCGKTQLLLQAAANAATQGFNVLFVSHAAFPAGLFRDRIVATAMGALAGVAPTQMKVDAALARVRVVDVDDAFDLLGTLFDSMRGMMAAQGMPAFEDPLFSEFFEGGEAGSASGEFAPADANTNWWSSCALVVVDGFGDMMSPLMAESMWRAKTAPRNAPALSGRTVLLHAQRVLRRLATDFHLSVIVTNRVAWISTPSFAAAASSGAGRYREPVARAGLMRGGYKATLGRSWSFVPNVRILLTPPRRTVADTDFGQSHLDDGSFWAMLVSAPPLSAKRLTATPFNL